MIIRVKCIDTYVCDVPEDIAEQYLRGEITKADIVDHVDNQLWDNLVDCNINYITLE